jgi:hypothetical protein
VISQLFATLQLLFQVDGVVNEPLLRGLRVCAQDRHAILDGTASLVTAILNCFAPLSGSSAALRIGPVPPTRYQFG